MRYLPPIMLVVVSWASAHAAEAPPYYDADAIVINVSERDLNLALEDLWSSMGSGFEGTKEEMSSSGRGLHYKGRFSTPVIDLKEGGQASIDLTLEEARVRVDSVERKLLGRRVSCEGLGADLHPDRALDMSLELSFMIAAQDVQIIPTAVDVSDSKDSFRLVKPTRCRRNLIPTFMLWWIAKPFLQRQFRDLDQKLLLGAERGAEQLRDDKGAILYKTVDVEGQELFVYPRMLRTDLDALWISAAGSSDRSRPDDPLRPPPSALAPSSSRSFLAVSEETLNAIMDRVYLRWSSPSRQPKGPVGKLFRSHEILTLVPGLRQVTDREELQWGVRFTSPPRVELDRLGDLAASPGQAILELDKPLAEDRPLVTLLSAGIEVEISRGGETPEVLGTLSIDSGIISAIPHPNPLGGISLQVVRNEWEVSSHGIEFEEQLLAATVQELVFGELFETRYEPLARHALSMGPIRFEPSDFAVVDDYLVIDLRRVPPPPSAPMRTDSPRASR